MHVARVIYNGCTRELWIGFDEDALANIRRANKGAIVADRSPHCVSAGMGYMSDSLERDSEFARRAVERRLLSRTDVQQALQLQDRYRSAGSEVPSLPRILVNTNKIAKEVAGDLLRQIHEDSQGRIPVPVRACPLSRAPHACPPAGSSPAAA
jgi:hypothetical protein